jgi:hypothetical protein
VDLWNNYLKWIIATVLTMTVVPYFTAIIASWLGHVSKKMLVENLGPNSQLAVGGLGVAIHESGHALFALLFGHKITKIQILNFHYADNGTLGSVEHSWRKNNVYQQLGNFFIGLAPYYMCSIVLYFLQKVLLHNNLELSTVLPTSGQLQTSVLSDIFNAVISNFTNVFSNTSIIMIIIYLVLSVMIASTGYDLSTEDLHTVNQGIVPWMVVLLVLSLILTIFNMQSFLMAIISVVIVFSVLFLLQAILYILLAIIFIRIISIF